MKLFLLRKLNILKALLLFLPFFLMSCFEENEYKIALETYVKEDIIINNNRKEYELTSLKNLSEERPEDFETMYQEAVTIYALISKFEDFLLKTEDIDVINEEFQIIKEKITNLNLKHYNLLKEEFGIQPLTKESEKYNLISRLKNMNFDRYNMFLGGGCDLSTISSYKTKMLASRLNDSIVVLNIYSRLVRKYNYYDEVPSFDIKINGNIDANTFVGFYIKPSTSCEAYLLKSKSDTLFVDAILKTNNISKLIIAKNSSYITVGELKEFDENYLEDYFKEIKN